MCAERDAHGQSAARTLDRRLPEGLELERSRRHPRVIHRRSDLTGPFDTPWNGADEIVAGWIEARDEPGTTDFRYEVVAIGGDTAVVQGVTDYFEPPPPRKYGNLWVIRLAADGRAAYYLEFWEKKEEST